MKGNYTLVLLTEKLNNIFQGKSHNKFQKWCLVFHQYLNLICRIYFCKVTAWNESLETHKRNTQSIMQNEFFCHKSNQLIFTRKLLKYNSLAENVCMFLSKIQLGFGSSKTQLLYFWRPVLLKNCQKVQIPCFSRFSF